MTDDDRYRGFGGHREMMQRSRGPHQPRAGRQLRWTDHGQQREAMRQRTGSGRRSGGRVPAARFGGGEMYRFCCSDLRVPS